MLEPLQAEGRTLKPSLIHWDLWEENTGTDLASDQPVVFDPAVMYAHNEFELGMWRRDVVRFGKSHVRQYLRHVPPSEPFEQWDDRNRLYSIKYDLAHGIALPGTMQSQRQLWVKTRNYMTALADCLGKNPGQHALSERQIPCSWPSWPDQPSLRQLKGDCSAGVTYDLLGEHIHEYSPFPVVSYVRTLQCVETDFGPQVVQQKRLSGELVALQSSASGKACFDHSADLAEFEGVPAGWT